MLDKDAVFTDLDLDKEYTPPVEEVPEEIKEEVKEVVVPEVKEEEIVTAPEEEILSDGDYDEVGDELLHPEVKEEIKEEIKEEVPEEISDDMSVEDILKSIEGTEEEIEDKKEEIKEEAAKTGDENLVAKVDELMTKLEESDRLNARKDQALQTITGEHSKLTKSSDFDKVRINELESLMSPVEDNNDLKALIAYSTKGDEGKEKRVEILKKLLEIDGYDINGVETERTRQEKSALGGEQGSGITTGFEIDKKTDEVFSDL